MRAIYLTSVFLHILAAMVWVGGMTFLVIVLVPALRQREFTAIAPALVRWSGLRFRPVGWLCFGILIATGSVNLLFRGYGWEEFQSAEFWTGSFGRVLLVKLVLVAAILAVSGLHDFLVGPRASAAWQSNPLGAETRRWRRYAANLGRLNLLLALAVVVLGIALVRGLPF